MASYNNVQGVKPATGNISYAISFCASLIVFTFLAYEVIYLHHDAFDKIVIRYFSQYRPVALIDIFSAITFFGSAEFLLPAYLILIVYLLIRKYFHEAIGVAVSSLLSVGLVNSVKILFHRQRPDHPLIHNVTTYSFPSGHAFSSLLFFIMLAFLIRQQMAPSVRRTILMIFLLVIPVVIGLSRIVLNVHYATDVIAGFCMGVLWLLITWKVYNFF